MDELQIINKALSIKLTAIAQMHKQVELAQSTAQPADLVTEPAKATQASNLNNSLIRTEI